MDAVAELRALEARKRRERISTPEFHALAEEVEAMSQHIFRLATESVDLADTLPSGDDTIEDLVETAAEGDDSAS